MKAVLAAAATVAGLSACGSGGGARTPSLSNLPLAPGARQVVKLKLCNGGANAYCAIELVVQDRRYGSSRALVLAQRDLLRDRGWIGGSPDTGIELADDSPGHRLRVTYASAVDDLQGIDLGWITRPWLVESALDRAVFDGVPTMSLLLEASVQ